jgi:hypothetical protein
MRRAVVIAAVSAVLITVVAAGAAVAGIAHSAVVTENPGDTTPHVLPLPGPQEASKSSKATVLALAVVGDKVVVGGRFAEVSQQRGGPAVRRANLFAYNRLTGQIDSGFAPDVAGEVSALEAGEDGTVYVGGRFRTVNGVAQRGLTRLRLADGSRVDTFAGTAVQGDVAQLVRRGAWLYVGGNFTGVNGRARTAVARLDAATGAVDDGFNPVLSGPRSGGRLSVVGMAIDPAGAKLVIDGNFSDVNGQARTQIAIFDISTSAVLLSGWSTNRFAPACPSGADTYLRDVDFAPDGSYFVVVTTGGPHDTANDTLCDSASRWDPAAPAGDQQPGWVNWTGGDTLWSVSVTGAAVYVGGHQRWMDNPDGQDAPGPGAVERPGIAALDPATGRALAWNPTRTRGVGAEILLATTDGLIVGSDTDELGHEYHGRLGMFPLP